MLNPHERQHLIELQDELQSKGSDLCEESRRMLMEADESDLDKLIEFMGEDYE